MRQFADMPAAAEAFLGEYCAMYPRERAFYNYYPGGAAHFGIHSGAGKVPDYRPERVAARLRELDGWRDAFATLAARADGDEARLDLAIMRWVADAEYFALAELRPHRTVPAHYASSVVIATQPQRAGRRRRSR